MSKTIKIISSLLSILAILIIVGIIALFTLIDPNKFKTQIQNQIRTATNFDVEIKGKIHWSIYPTLGVEVENIIVKNPDASAQQKLADIADASVKVKLLPLFHNQIQIDAIRLDTPTIYLVKDAQGKGNWETSAIKSPDIKKTDDKSADEKSTSAKKNYTVSISSFEIHKGTLVFRDIKKNQSMNFNDLMLVTKNAAFSKNIPVDTSFKLDIPQQKIHSDIAFRTLINVNEKFQTVSLDDIYLKFDESTLRGKLTFNTVQNAITFKCDIDELNLDRYSTSLNKKQAAKNEILNTHNLLASADNNLTGIKIRTKEIPSVSGTLQIQKLVANNVKITDIKAVINTPRHNVIKIAPFTARAYEGEINSSITVDMASNTPLWHVIKSGTNLQIAPMLKDLADKELITGAFSFTSDVTTKGSTKEEILRNLSGNAKFNLKNGALKNIDINQAIIIASQIFSKQAPSFNSPSSQTDFATVSMTADFQNGIMTTNDLTLSSPILLVSGKGNVNLVSEELHFNLLATVLGINLGSKVQQLQQMLGGIPLQVTGTFSNYRIQPDSEAIANAAAKELIEQNKEKIQKKVDKFLQKNTQDIGDKLKGLLHQ